MNIYYSKLDPDSLDFGQKIPVLEQIVEIDNFKLTRHPVLTNITSSLSPQIDIGPNNNLHILWYDNRTVTADGGGRNWEVFYKCSSKMDLYLSASDIEIVSELPISGDLVFVNVSVKNMRKIYSVSAEIAHYYKTDPPSDRGTLGEWIFFGRTNCTINPGSSNSTSILFNTSNLAGNVSIRVVLDPENNIDEH